MLLFCGPIYTPPEAIAEALAQLLVAKGRLEGSNANANATPSTCGEEA